MQSRCNSNTQKHLPDTARSLDLPWIMFKHLSFGHEMEALHYQNGMPLMLL